MKKLPSKKVQAAKAKDVLRKKNAGRPRSSNEELVVLNTELQKKNYELTQLNNDLNNFFASTDIPMIIVGNDLRIRRFTPASTKVMSLIGPDVGRPIGDIKLNVGISNLEGAIRNVIDTINIHEVYVQDRDGRWYFMRIRPYRTVDNKIDGAVITMYDVNDIKRAQDELKRALGYNESILETIADSILVLDKNLFVLSANKAFYRMFELSKPAVEKQLIYEIDNCQWKVLELRRLLEDVLPKKTVFSDYEIPLNLAKKGSRVFSLSGRQIFKEGIEEQKILLVIRDITELRKAREILERDKKLLEEIAEERSGELLKSQIELEQSKRLYDIGILSVTVAHELRSPLAAIAMAAANIKRKTDQALLGPHLLSIEEKIFEGSQIINNLLFYSRLKMPHYECFNLCGLIRETIVLFEKRCDKKQLIKDKTESKKDIWIEADPLQIKEVLVNLLSNARDAILQKTAEIGVDAVERGGYVDIRVEDNGAGIKEEDLKKVFDPFFSTKSKGTGLGLSVCYQIVNIHKGSINIESEPGKGTVVSVRLPKGRKEKDS